MNKNSHKIWNIGPIIMKITQNLTFDMCFKFQLRKPKIIKISTDVSKKSAKSGNFSSFNRRKVPFFSHLFHIDGYFCTLCLGQLKIIKNR